MGWQSFFIPYDSDDEYKAILQCIYHHNNNDDYDELLYICKNSKDKCVMFGNTCGRDRTYTYFFDGGFNIHYYECDEYETVFGHANDINTNIPIDEFYQN